VSFGSPFFVVCGAVSGSALPKGFAAETKRRFVGVCGHNAKSFLQTVKFLL
jgi:hypothetical protein